MNKEKKASNIAANIEDGSTIALVGFGAMGQCDEILKAIGDRFIETGHPKDLTVFHTAGQSGFENGIEYIAEKGLIKRIIGGHWGLAPKTRALIEDNLVDCYCWPQGQLTHLLRTMANRLPGQISPVGLGTFVDPRINGGKFNERTKNKEDLVKLVDIEGEEFLLYPSIPFDYIFIRGTSMDESFNISAEEEALKLEILSGAQAAKAYGGKVIAQIKYLVKDNSIKPKDVIVPGYLVDYFVQSELPHEYHRQTPITNYSPFLTGDLIAPTRDFIPRNLSIRKVIGRRAMYELTENSIVNLGIGIPGDEIGDLTIEEEVNDKITLTLESGVVGGVPQGGNEFGVARNATAILDHGYLFDYYHGTGVDLTFMGAAEIDRFGNVNVSHFANRAVGCGGFIDITQSAKKVVFCTTFTGGGLDAQVKDSQMVINTEGSINKFKQDVSQITFSGAYALKNKQEVLYVTERAVFELTDRGLLLTEVAPGIDLDKDILNMMDFKPRISDRLKEMDIKIFKEKKMGLKKWIKNKDIGSNKSN